MAVIWSLGDECIQSVLGSSSPSINKIGLWDQNVFVFVKHLWVTSALKPSIYSSSVHCVSALMYISSKSLNSIDQEEMGSQIFCSSTFSCQTHFEIKVLQCTALDGTLLTCHMLDPAP